MKVRGPLAICAVLAIAVVFLSILLLQPPSFGTTNGVSLYLRGYTNTAGTNMAVFEVTNHTKTQFVCFVGPRASEASKNGRPLFHDTSAAAAPGTLPPLGVFAFSVPSSPDTNLWRVSVQFQELDVARSKWQQVFAAILRVIGVHSLDAKTYQLTSPAFSRSDEQYDTY